MVDVDVVVVGGNHSHSVFIKQAPPLAKSTTWLPKLTVVSVTLSHIRGLLVEHTL